MRLVRRNGTPREQLEQVTQLAGEHRQIFDDIQAMENPFAHLLPPNDSPPTPAPGQRKARDCDELAREAEATERSVA